jgi:hypothetical protein
MRLSTLVLAWVFAAVAGSTAFADSQESGAPAVAPAVETAEGVADAEVADHAGTEASESLTPEDSAKLQALAPEAAGAAETEVMQARETVTWDDFEDPGFDPAVPAGPAPAATSGATPKAHLSAKAAAIPLGPLGVDAKGVEGRIHTVSRGETLWDISEAYLGTPWVWPSVWHENSGIQNPHVIEPGDRIWITSNEMRRVSDEEANQLVSAASEPEPEMEIVSDDSELEFLPEDDTLAYDDEPLPASVEDETELSVPAPMAPSTADTGEILVLPKSPDANFATARLMDESVEIVDAPEIRAFLTQGDLVYLALGEGETQVGDEYEIFRDVLKVRDIETGAVLGYHYDELGWLKIEKVEGESSTARIMGVTSEIQRGDHIVPRNEPPKEIPVRRALEDISGAIVFTPGIRWMR